MNIKVVAFTVSEKSSIFFIVAISVLCLVLVMPWVSLLSVIVAIPGLEVIVLYSCSTQLGTKVILHIDVKMPTVVGIIYYLLA